ncbi:hypothetical protein MMYC01_207161 [Madurella mycetomatis]|uniref:Uncharacterized protein n=1 Tax=Madurella mycetomatis TaxID=100816 RepID=A0A175VXJ1_9PEZI|nr:hypothetical protein MMYC01_207161 [Madurella mycetomatis]
MTPLSYDITLLIAEQVDSDSMVPLMLSCKANYQLIRSHKRSIINAKITNLVRDSMLRPPLGTLLSSSTLDQQCLGRRVLEPWSFAVAKELELRSRKINNLFNTAFPNPCGQLLHETIKRLAQFTALPPKHMERLIDGLRDACMVVDRIADCAAVVHLQREREACHVNDGGWAIEHEVHLARQRYIRSLPPIRLAFLTLLASLVGINYARDFPALDLDPLKWERVTALRETFLRHGTVVIDALLCPSEADATTKPCEDVFAASDACRPPHAQNKLARFYASRVAGVLGELLEYEGRRWELSGSLEDDYREENIPDSLHMTMLQTFQSHEEIEEEKRQEGIEEKDDTDGGWLFSIDVTNLDTDEADDHSPPVLPKVLDPRDALILRWIKQS